MQDNTPPTTTERTMANFLISNGTVTVTTPAPALPAAGLMTTPLPVRDLGTCEDCGADLAPLTGNDGEVRTTFCEYCEFGS